MLLKLFHRSDFRDAFFTLNLLLPDYTSAATKPGNIQRQAATLAVPIPADATRSLTMSLRLENTGSVPLSTVNNVRPPLTQVLSNLTTAEGFLQGLYSTELYLRHSDGECT